MNWQDTTGKLQQAAEDYILNHVSTISLTDLAEWAYLYMARDTLYTYLQEEPVLAHEYESMVKLIDGSAGKGMLSPGSYIEMHVSAARDIVYRFEAKNLNCVAIEEVGATVVDDQALHMWMVTGCMPPDDWSDHMPWSPYVSVALDRWTLSLTEDEARAVAADWHPGEWTALYAFASTGVVGDLGSLVKELDECLIEAGDNPAHATGLYNLVAWLTIHTYGRESEWSDSDF